MVFFTLTSAYTTNAALSHYSDLDIAGSVSYGGTNQT